MAAPIGTEANRFNGIREFSNVTNTYAGYFQSDEAAYTLSLPFQPDKFEWWNATKYGTNDNNLSGVWFRDFAAGDGLIVARGTTTLTSTLETTNGITVANTSGGFTDQHLTISGMTDATGVTVVTTGTHTLVDGDRVVITKVIGTCAPEVNNKTFVVDVLSSTTFALYDVYGNPVTIAGTYTSSGQATVSGPRLYTENEPVIYKLTLGTAVVGNDNDIIYFVATQFNNYVNIGDTA